MLTDKRILSNIWPGKSLTEVNRIAFGDESRFEWLPMASVSEDVQDIGGILTWLHTRPNSQELGLRCHFIWHQFWLSSVESLQHACMLIIFNNTLYLFVLPFLSQPFGLAFQQNNIWPHTTIISTECLHTFEYFPIQLARRWANTSEESKYYRQEGDVPKHSNRTANIIHM